MVSSGLYTVCAFTQVLFPGSPVQAPGNEATFNQVLFPGSPVQDPGNEATFNQVLGFKGHVRQSFCVLLCAAS